MEKYVIQDPTIKLTVKTKNRLAKLGSKGDTFEQIVKKLLDKNSV